MVVLTSLFIMPDGGGRQLGYEGTAEGQFEPGPSLDSHVSFLEALSNLPEAPTRMIVDGRGIVWFPVFSPRTLLYSYDPSSGKVETFALPDGTGTGLFSGFDFSPNGHYVLGDGYIVVDFDPAAATTRTYELSEAPVHFEKQTTEAGTWITDLDVGEDGIAYVARMNAASITAVDLSSGSSKEIAIPGRFGPVVSVEWTPEGLYISNEFGTLEVQPQLGVLKTSGEFSSMDGAAASFVRAGSTVYALGIGNGVRILNGTHADRVTGASLDSIYVEDLAVDEKSGALWVSNEGLPVIQRIDTASGEIRTYALPTYTIPDSAVACPPDTTCPGGIMETNVQALVSGPNGEVYFSSTPFNRVGVIRP